MATRQLFLVGKISPNNEKFAEADGCPGDNESCGHQERIKGRKCVRMFLKVSGRTSMTTAHMTMKSGVKTEEMFIQFSFFNKAESSVEIHH